MSLSKPNLDHFYDLIKDKKYIRYLSDSELSEDVESTIENNPWSDWNLDQLKTFLHKPTSTFRKCPEHYKPYNIVQTRDPLDHWVAESMKLWNRPLYDSLKGYNKLARLGRAYPFLAMFSRPLVSRKTVLSSPRYRWAYDKALGDFRRLFSQCKVDTLGLSDMMKQIPGNTSAGFPYLGKKKSEVWSEVHQKSIQNYFTLLKNRKLDYKPCVLALRGHLSPLEQNKTRAIWVVPFETIVMENLLFRNVYNFVYEKLPNVIMTGKKTLYRLRNYLNINNGMDLVNIDFSGWDAYRHRFLIIDLFDIFKKCINLKKTPYGSESSIFYFVRKAFLDSKLVLPDGSVYQKSCGTPSGSLLTALINSSANYIGMKTALLVGDYERNTEHMNVLGDDCSFFIGVEDTETVLRHLSEILLTLFGLKMKPEKCIIAKHHEPIENRRYIGYNLRGSTLYKPLEDFFKSVLYPEHEVKSVFVSFSRVFSYFMLGGYNHESFVRFFKQYLGHYRHLLSGERDLFREEVLKSGNLRVIKHVFSVELDAFLRNFTLKSFHKINFLTLPYFLTLDVPLYNVLF